MEPMEERTGGSVWDVDGAGRRCSWSSSLRGLDVFHGKHVGCGVRLDCATALATCKMASASACALRMMAPASPSARSILSLFHSLGLVDPGCFLSLGTQNQRLLLSLGVPRISARRLRSACICFSSGHPHTFGRSDVLQPTRFTLTPHLLVASSSDHLEFGVGWYHAK